MPRTAAEPPADEATRSRILIHRGGRSLYSTATRRTVIYTHTTCSMERFMNLRVPAPQVRAAVAAQRNALRSRHALSQYTAGPFPLKYPAML